MYITSVELENFKIHRSLKVELSNINVIVGQNAKGKTSILDAISYGLYGVTGDGATKKELLTNSDAVKPGEIPPKNGKVIITFDNGFKIIRDLSNICQLLDTNGDKITDKATEIERWLNIPRDMFMTLIYGVQGKMSETFLKFNATQKDFIDSLFSINDYMDPILSTIQETKKKLEYEFIELESKKNNKANSEKYIVDSLANMECTSMEDLSARIKNVEEQMSHFGNMEKIAEMKQNQSSIKSKYEYAKSYKSSSERDLQSTELKLKELEDTFITTTNSLKQALQMQETEVCEYVAIKNKINSICDVNTWYDNLLNIINLMDSNNLTEYKTNAISIINYIRQIDVYRQQYTNMLTNWNNIKYQIDSNNSTITSIKSRIEQMDHDSSVLESQLTQINESLQIIGANGDGSNIDAYKNLINVHSILVSNKNAIESYSNQIKDITFNEERYNQVVDMRNKINDIESIFKREGFPQYIRKRYILNIAEAVEKMLIDFGFDSLLPITVNDNGEFLYKGVKTRSISGAQKACTSIIQKFIYGRMIAPMARISLMILDEPTDSLDGERVELFKNFLTTLNKNLGLQLIMVTHNRDIIPDGANIIEL